MDDTTRDALRQDHPALAEALAAVTRVEVIDEGGRAYTRWNAVVTPSLQDGGRTLKLFVEQAPESPVDRRFPRWRV